MHARPRVLAVDDDEACLELIRTTLAQAGFDVAVALGGTEALAAADEHAPWVAIVDVGMPGLNGYELSRTLIERHGVPIVFVSGYRTDPADRVAGLLMGAADYIVKPFDPSELVARVRRVTTPPPRHGRAPGLPDTLTPREREILQLIVDGIPPAEIAYRLVLAPKTVSTHSQRIFAKLGVHSRSEAVSSAVAAGMQPRAVPH